MSEELKPCPFCGGEATTTKKGPIRNQWWEVVCVSGECGTASITGDTEECAIAAWNTRADLLPVVKPLEWLGDIADSSFAKWQWTAEIYMIEERNHAPNVFDLICNSWDFEDAKRFDSLKAAKTAAQADHDERIRSKIDMIDPAELVAGAYEAMRKVMGDYHWNRYASREEGGKLHHPAVFSSHTYQDVQDLIDAITPADAQRALDAAIAKAVNEKLDEVAAKAAEWAMKNPDEDMILNVFADAILAMKEPE